MTAKKRSSTEEERWRELEVVWARAGKAVVYGELERLYHENEDLDAFADRLYNDLADARERPRRTGRAGGLAKSKKRTPRLRDRDARVVAFFMRRLRERVTSEHITSDLEIKDEAYGKFGPDSEETYALGKKRATLDRLFRAAKKAHAAEQPVRS